MLRIPHPFIAEKGRFLLFYLFDVRVRSQLIRAHSFSLCSIFGMLPHLNHRTKFCISHSLALSLSHFLSGSLFRPVFFVSIVVISIIAQCYFWFWMFFLWFYSFNTKEIILIQWNIRFARAIVAYYCHLLFFMAFFILVYSMFFWLDRFLCVPFSPFGSRILFLIP